MGTFKRFIYSLLTIVLILLGAIFLFTGIVKVDFIFQTLSYLRFSQVRIGVMVVGILILVFALFILVDLTLASDKAYEYLVEGPDGSILISKDSLENTVKRSIEKFLSTKVNKVRVNIVDGETIEVKSKIDLYKDFDIGILSTKIKENINESLKELTGLDHIESKLYFDRISQEDLVKRGNDGSKK
ncbi:MAG: alkaline shock response membrane anchor protein AmaP [Anaerococcus sp.]|nr:alkaline shock response membrane anchor protein AmaP [Anaerococcus sp.]